MNFLFLSFRINVKQKKKGDTAIGAKLANIWNPKWSYQVTEHGMVRRRRSYGIKSIPAQTKRLGCILVVVEMAYQLDSTLLINYLDGILLFSSG